MTAPVSSMLTATNTSLPPQQMAQVKSAAQDFEAVFVSEMMSHMFEGIGVDPVFGGGSGEQMFRGMMIQEYGKQMAKTNSLGISNQLQAMMIQMQQHRG